MYEACQLSFVTCLPSVDKYNISADSIIYRLKIVCYMYIISVTQPYCFMVCCSDDRIGRTPLCVAAYYGNEAIVELLLQSGAHIDGEFSDSINDDIDWKVCL